MGRTRLAQQHVRGGGHDKAGERLVDVDGQVQREGVHAQGHRQREHDAQEQQRRQEVALRVKGLGCR